MSEEADTRFDHLTEKDYKKSEARTEDDFKCASCGKIYDNYERHSITGKFYCTDCADQQLERIC